MCLAIPGEIIDIHQGVAGMSSAIVEFGRARREISLVCVPHAAVGDHILAHAGMAIAIIDASHAERVWTSLEELGAARANTGEHDREPS